MQDPSDNSTEKPDFIKWEITLPHDDDFITIYDPIVYENLVIVPVNEQGIILALNKETGEEVWRWSEARDTYDGADGFGQRNYIYDNIMVMCQRNIFYAIDLNLGETIWHNKNDLQSSSNLFGYEGIVGINFRVPNEAIEYLTLDIYTGETTSITYFSKEDVYNMSGNSPVMHNYNNEIFFAFVQKKWLSSPEGYEEYGWMHNRNLSGDGLKWVTDTIPKNSPLVHVPGLPYFFEDKIVLVSNSIQCYNLLTGDLDWIDQSHTNTFTWSTGLKISDGKVFGNNENGYMIALDVDTGAELWRTDTGGTGSRIEHYDGKLYIAQITGYYSPELNDYSPKSSLLVLNADTGEVLHHIQAPYENDRENHWYWDDVITVDQETGLIYTADHNKVMCIELED